MKKEEEKAIIYTIEECKNCKHRLKREFKIGDYVYKDGSNCTRCGASTLITMIYAEYMKV